MAEMTRYCLCCGEKVPCNAVSRDGQLFYNCTYCGFTVESTKAQRGGRLRRIFLADDSDFIRKLLEDALLRAGVGEEVRAFENGAALYGAMCKLWEAGERVDLFLLDIQMPVMDGLRTAAEIRAIEAKRSLSPTPLLFFSSSLCDESLRASIEQCQPAAYINKGSVADPRKLAERVDEIIPSIRKAVPS